MIIVISIYDDIPEPLFSSTLLRGASNYVIIMIKIIITIIIKILIKIMMKIIMIIKVIIKISILSLYDPFDDCAVPHCSSRLLGGELPLHKSHSRSVK